MQFLNTEDHARRAPQLHVCVIDAGDTLLGQVATALALAPDGPEHVNPADETALHGALERATLIIVGDGEGGHDGLATLRRLRAHPDHARTPVVFVAAPDDGRIDQCFQAGADDYVSRPIRAPELRARLRSLLERQHMLSELRDAATLDPLTGLPNRAWLSQQLEAAIGRALNGEHTNFALLFLDFDRFKYVNDSLGHGVGDRLLQAIAQRLRTNLRASDTVSRPHGGTVLSRLGGDEFVVMLDGVTDIGSIERIADRMVSMLAQPYDLGDHRITSTASIGVVPWCAGYGDADAMLRDADTAMYAAKARGKGCYVLFDPAMREAARERLALENDLHTAVAQDLISLAWQPIYSLEDGLLVGAEALARWTHPERGPISPNVFFPIAEETRLVGPLSARLLEQACHRFAAWAGQRGAPRYCAFNLSRAQLGDPDLDANVARLLQRHGLAPSQLQLEMTESMIMADPEVAISQLQRLRRRGVRLAMDDFGSGHSSLASLHRFPFDVIKIDRSFVAALDGDRREFVALVHAVIELAWNLGMECVAEGIDDEQQVATLLAMECGYGQGFLLGAPQAGDRPPPARWRRRGCPPDGYSPAVGTSALTRSRS